MVFDELLAVGKKFSDTKCNVDLVEFQLFKEILKNEIMLQALGEIETYKAVDMHVRHVAARALREVNEI